MKKQLALLLLAGLCTLGAHAQLLYRILGNDLQQPSYIVGTNHVAPVSFADSIPGIHEAMAATSQVFGELAFDDMMNPDSIAYLQQAMMLPQGQRLKDVLMPEQYQKVNGMLKKIFAADLDNPQMEAQLGGITPKALVTQLTLLSYISRRPGMFDPSNPFDGYFQKMAKQAGKPVSGLETVAFQAKTLLLSTPLPRQIEQLMCYVDHQDMAEEMTTEANNAFFAQDLKAMNKAMELKLNNSCDDTPEEMDMLIYNRNADWLKKMPAIMRAAPTFFAVGAAHLPGDRGVLQGLRALGYTVEGVK